MTIALEQGDVTAAVLHILRNDPDLNSAYPDLTVSANRVGFERRAHWIEVTRRGGVPAEDQHRYQDVARIDMDSYGPTRTVCMDIAKKAALAVKLASHGNFVGYGLTVVYARHEQGLSEMPDPDTDDPRVFQTLLVRVAARPDVPGVP